MKSFVGLLRGINVGGKNRLQMARLRALFEQVGASKVSTYLQSGNVLFQSLNTQDALLAAQSVTRLLDEEDGLVVPIVVRTAQQLEAAIAMHPFLGDEADERMVSVGFLSDKPAPSLVAQLDSARSMGDRFEVRGKDIYLHTPQGMARSKLTVGYFDRMLSVTTTVRNMKTVRALVAFNPPV